MFPLASQLVKGYTRLVIDTLPVSTMSSHIFHTPTHTFPETVCPPPGELAEGYTRSVDDNPFSRLLGRRDPAFAPPERLELDLDDPSDFDAQLFDQVGHGLWGSRGEEANGL